MPALRKFMFTNVFDDQPMPMPAVVEALPNPPEPVVAEPPPPPEPTFSAADLEAARAEGIAAGREEGVRMAAEAIGQQIADASARILAAMDALFAQQSVAADMAAREAVAVAVTVARKLLPAMAERGATEEVGRLVAQALELTREEPRVVIRVTEALHEPLEAHIRGMVEGRGFQGQVVLVADAGIAAGDCAIEWSSGGAERDTAALWQQIDAILERNLNEAPAPVGDPVAS